MLPAAPCLEACQCACPGFHFLNVEVNLVPAIPLWLVMEVGPVQTVEQRCLCWLGLGLRGSEVQVAAIT